jgi:hypothetical protein
MKPFDLQIVTHIVEICFETVNCWYDRISVLKFINFSKMGKYKAHDFPDQYNDFHC